jgi:hypothetical protein
MAGRRGEPGVWRAAGESEEAASMNGSSRFYRLPCASQRATATLPQRRLSRDALGARNAARALGVRVGARPRAAVIVQSVHPKGKRLATKCTSCARRPAARVGHASGEQMAQTLRGIGACSAGARRWERGLLCCLQKWASKRKVDSGADGNTIRTIQRIGTTRRHFPLVRPFVFVPVTLLSVPAGVKSHEQTTGHPWPRRDFRETDRDGQRPSSGAFTRLSEVHDAR